MNPLKKQLTNPLSLSQRFFITLISLYQKTLSPDHGWLKVRYPYGFCRFYPSCSQFVKKSIENQGLIKGLYLGMFRIIHCNPWQHPKVDLPQF